MRIFAKFRLPADESTLLKHHLGKLRGLTRLLASEDSFSKEWFLRAKRVQDAWLYPLLDESGDVASAIQAVLNTRYQNSAGAISVALWNGKEEETEGAAIGYRYRCDPIPDELEIEYPNPISGLKRLSNAESTKRIAAYLAENWTPLFISAAPFFYGEVKVFQDRPGVGWMLYLPIALTAQQVPEAGALIPVMEDKKQKGTIIISITDGPFDIDNPEHVKIANAIEIRLVDQDLLPRYVDL